MPKKAQEAQLTDDDHFYSMKARTALGCSDLEVFFRIPSVNSTSMNADKLTRNSIFAGALSHASE